MGVARVVLNKHYVSDVLAGATVGLIAGLFGRAAGRKIPSFTTSARFFWARIALLVLVGGCAVFLSDAPKYLFHWMGPAILFLALRRIAVDLDRRMENDPETTD